MLISLYVKDFAIVREVEITPSAGLTVVSGETGAGKSLLVDALMLLTGSRADAGMVRHGAERAELIAHFALASQSPAFDWLREADLDQDDECQLRRVIRADGGSRAYINGRPATISQLSELGALLVEIHGQHEHQVLLDRRQQLKLLDNFAGHASVLAELRGQARLWHEANNEIARLEKLGDAQERRLFLSHQIDELAAEALSTEAIAELIHEHRRQSHATTLIEGCARVAALLEADETQSLPGLLRRARQDITKLSSHEPALMEVDGLLDSAAIQIDEAATALERLRDTFDLDPERLSELEGQLARLHDLARKHRVPVEALQERQTLLQNELDSIDDTDSTLKQLYQQRSQAHSDWQNLARRVSAARQEAAQRLSHDVSQLISELSMAGGAFSITLDPIDSDEPHADGAERTEFLVAANAGQPPRPLRKVASGGELSRISLAIQVATIDLASVPTMVFDEVDTGIGGGVAEVVGQKLRALGAERQVLCVTHLPQVAAQGHNHLRVSKYDGGDGTQSRIETLSFEARVEEVARMLGGIKITAETLAHARQMVEHAQRA